MKKYITYVILLSLIEISAALYLTFWRELFWNYVEARNFHGFCVQIAVFTATALIFCLVNAYAGYYTTLCAIKFREQLNNRAYRIVHDAENLNQRVQEDCRDYPDLLLQIIFGIGKAAIYVIVFAVSLAINFNLIYLGIIIAYASISTLIAQRIAKPLVSLNYVTQQAEATYRNNLSGLNFANCIQIMLGLALKTKRLSYFQTFYAQIAVILPIVIVAPAYFGGALTLGALMQATGTMGTITDNLSFGITSFNIINKFKSCKKRLHEIGMFDKE
jgi:putative ATP-binding cassette transporter